MPVYNDVPTKAQWKIDLGLHTVFGNYKSPFPAMERLGRLIDAYHNIPARPGLLLAFEKITLKHLMYRQCQFVLKNNGKGNEYAKQKMGGVLNTKQIGAVNALQTFLSGELTHFLRCTLGELQIELTKTFGREVIEQGRQEDWGAVRDGMMHWYASDAARKLFKLSFRGGLAYKWDYNGGGKGNLVIYDTASSGDNIEFGGSLYAMDHRGRIYASGREGELTLKHSSFTAGAATQCAGTMRINNGQVIWVSGRSGHYQPTVAQMMNLLERLRGYQVKLDKVTVYRENFNQNFVDTPFKNFEGCNALDLLVRRAWPTGVEPNKMRVG